MKLTSPVFQNGDDIPARYTCDDKNVSPPLEWTDLPSTTQSLVLVMDDPDAPHGTWDHWLIFNLPPKITSLPEGIKQFPPGTRFGQNGWGKTEYGGPCPPDRQHRYFFRLYALNEVLDLPNGTTKEQIQQAAKNKIIAQTELIGLYARPGQKTWNH